jgi:L-amino acid N-acyltransferase YncA
MNLAFQPMTAADWPAVARIHAEGIATGQATFESVPAASWEEFSKNKPAAGCIMARTAEGEAAGWAVLSAVSTRRVYAGVAEVSVYVACAHRGQGIGDALLEELIRRSEAAGIWTLQSMTFPENTASITLQEKHGFRVVGIRERIGRMTHGPHAGRWRDVVLLERRSRVVGMD